MDSSAVVNKKYVDQAHMTPSGQQKDAFRYLMEDADHRSSENNISVTGIVDFDDSPHLINKKAYRLALAKDAGSNTYRSQIGFDLGSFPIGYYTFVAELFPIIVMHNVSATAQATTISINNQTTRTFTNYTKTPVQFHRWNSTPPQYFYLDLHGNATSGSRVLVHMIVYGVKGYVANVDSKIYDTLYAV